MHFSLAAILAVVPLVVSTANTTQEPYITIPLSRRTDVYRSDGSVDLETLKRETNHSTAKILHGLLNYERNTGQRHPLSLGVRDFKRAVASNPLTDYRGQGWWGTVSVGTPPVAFTIDFDTGSSDFIIPGPRCTNCGSHTRYNPGASSTSVRLRKTFSVEFGDGSTASGSLFNDTVTIAGLTATSQTFGAAARFSPGFNPLVDGIMGMAFRSISEFNANPVFLNLAAQGQTTSPIFAMKLTAGSSELTLGGLNSALYTGDVTWVPVTEQAHWQVNLDSVQVGGQVVVGSTPCIIDSGTTITMGHPADVARFYQQIPNSRLDPDGFYSFPCGAVIPEISFYFGNQAFSMTDTFNFGPVSRNSDRCVGGIRGEEDLDYWVIGITFMTNYYTAFDFGNLQVGFATLA